MFSKKEQEDLLRLGTKEEIRLSIFSMMRNFHSLNAALDVFDLELHDDMHSSKPLTMLSGSTLKHKIDDAV